MITNREVNRLKLISSSPVIQTISEGTIGTATVRVFQKEPWFCQRYVNQLDEFQKNSIVSDALSKWFQLRLFGLSAIILLPCIAFNLFWVQTGAALFALLMKYLMMLTADIN